MALRGFKLCRDFCRSILPWYYLNRFLRLSHKENQEAVFSHGVRSFVENGSVSITKNVEYLRQGDDIFLPPQWRNNREIMVWSETGYRDRKWKLPPEWRGVERVDIYWNKLAGLQVKDHVVDRDGKVYIIHGPLHSGCRVRFRLTKIFYDHYRNPGTPVVSGILFGEVPG